MLNLLIEYIDEIYAAREMRHEKVDDTFNCDLCRAEVVCARPADIFVTGSHHGIEKGARQPLASNGQCGPTYWPAITPRSPSVPPR
jgi:hypothetical protein